MNHHSELSCRPVPLGPASGSLLSLYEAPPGLLNLAWRWRLLSCWQFFWVYSSRSPCVSSIECQKISCGLHLLIDIELSIRAGGPAASLFAAIPITAGITISHRLWESRRTGKPFAAGSARARVTA